MIFTHHHKAFDGWSVIHFISGAGLAMLGLLFGISFEISTILMLVILIGWEYVEKYFGIGEQLPNVITDIILGAVAFFVFWYVFADTLTETQVRAFFILVVAQIAMLTVARLFRQKK